MLSFQKCRRIFPLLEFHIHVFGGEDSEVGSYYTDMSNYDDTLVKK